MADNNEERKYQRVFGLEVPEINPNVVPLEAVILIKAMDTEGSTTLFIRTTKGLNGWEEIGMLQIAQRTIEDSLAEQFVPTHLIETDDDEDEDDD
jgi:hypothetical protein